MNRKNKMASEETTSKNGAKGHHGSEENGQEQTLKALLKQAVNSEQAPDSLRDRIRRMIREN